MNMQNHYERQIDARIKHCQNKLVEEQVYQDSGRAKNAKRYNRVEFWESAIVCLEDLRKVVRKIGPDNLLIAMLAKPWDAMSGLVQARYPRASFGQAVIAEAERILQREAATERGNVVEFPR